VYDKLFGSKTRAKLLSLFLVNSEKAYYVREITRMIDEQINSVRRELSNLKSLDIVLSHERKGKLYYRANKKSDLYPELKKIFSKVSKDKVQEEETNLIKSVRNLGNVSYAALMGYFTKDNSSAVDIFVVGKVDKRKMKTFVSKLEKEAGKELNYSLMTLDEYEHRKMIFDRFITEVLASPKEVIIDYIEDDGKQKKAPKEV